MLGGDNQLFREVLTAVDAWVPTKEYGHESKFQNELQGFLDSELNSGGGGLGLDMGCGGERVVERESGRARADIVVNQTVGIEMKRELSNSHTKKLRGQIEEYLAEYPFVIVCACGIQDMDGWRRLKNVYSGRGGGLDINGGTVEFVHKDCDSYGQEPGTSGGSDDGLGPFSLDF